MNFLYLLNYFVFATLVVLLTVEMGMALLSLFNYKFFKSLSPGTSRDLWGIVGVFAVFYLINFESTYPKLLINIGTIYEIPLLITAILIIAKNTFATFAYGFSKVKREKISHGIYSAATLISAFLVTGIFTSVATGTGVNLNSNSINFFAMLFNPFNLLIFAGLALVSIFIAKGYTKEFGENSYDIFSFIVGFVLLFLGVVFYTPEIALKLFAGPILISIIVILGAGSVILGFLKNKYSGIISSLWLLTSIFIFGILQYSYIFGGQINLFSELTNSSMETAIIVITVFGYLIMAAFLFLIRKIGKLQNMKK